MSLSNDSDITNGYTYIYNRVLSALIDDSVIDDDVRVEFAKKITDAVWALHLSINKAWPTEKYNNFANTKSMVSSIISDISCSQQK